MSFMQMNKTKFFKTLIHGIDQIPMSSMSHEQRLMTNDSIDTAKVQTYWWKCSKIYLNRNALFSFQFNPFVCQCLCYLLFHPNQWSHLSVLLKSRLVENYVSIKLNTNLAYLPTISILITIAHVHGLCD